MSVLPNKADAPNPAIAPPFHIGHQWRGVGDPYRWAALRYMKSAIIVGATSVAVIIVGCTKEPSSSSTTLPVGREPVMISDGTNTWSLGATTINGTNVSATNVTVGIRTHEASK